MAKQSSVKMMVNIMGDRSAGMINAIYSSLSMGLMWNLIYCQFLGYLLDLCRRRTFLEKSLFYLHLMLDIICLIMLDMVVFVAAQWFRKSLSAYTVTVSINLIFNFNPVLPDGPKIPNFK